MTVGGLVVVRERAIKWILAWREIRGNQIATVRAVGIIKPAVILCPVRVPRARAIWDWIIGRGLFPDPKNSGDDFFFPGEALPWLGQKRRIRFCRGQIRINPQQGVIQWFARLLAQFHLRTRHRGRRILSEKAGDGRQ